MRNYLPSRKNIRLKNYDYSYSGMYFLTICVKNRLNLLGKIKCRKYIDLTQEGLWVENGIKNIEHIYKNILIDEYIIMPNHIHMILRIKYMNNITVSNIIKQFKTYVSKNLGYPIWQKSFYEHIIRNNDEYYKIKKYIKNNIINWTEDKYFS